MQLFYFKRISSECSEGAAGVYVCMYFCSFDVFCCILSRGVGWHWGLEDQALWSLCFFPSLPFPLSLPLSLPHISLQTLVIISFPEWGYLRGRKKDWWRYARRTMKKILCGCRGKWNFNLYAVSTVCFERLWEVQSQLDTLPLSWSVQMLFTWSGWFSWCSGM